MTGAAGTAAGGPLLSIVLPVGAVADFLPACLDSVLGQAGSATGVEVIAVDDAAPDGSGEILDARAAADPRLKVVHLGRRGGPGPARMRGLAEATGAYVWFADPDDLLAGGALAAVAQRLCRDEPDVLLVDYVILKEDGGTVPSPGAGLLAAPVCGAVTPAGRPAPGTLSLADRPALLQRSMTVWNKVIRRTFLAGLPVSFPRGIHEDVPVSCAVLLCAQRIALLDGVCYLYRRRPGSFLATPSMAHFAIFSSYEQVFALVASGAAGTVTPAVQAALFARAIEHYTTILASGLVPPGARREFFAQMVASYRRYRPAQFRRPPGLRGVKAALVGRDAYAAYRLLVALNAARVAARRAVARRR